MSLLASASLTGRTMSRSMGVSDAQPLLAFTFSAATLCVGHRFIGGQPRALSPQGNRIQRVTLLSAHAAEFGQHLESR
jgi:hypothetical protein